MKPEAQPAAQEHEGSLSIRDLKVVFNGFTAVDSVNMNVPRGDVRFLIGPNGAGKTTLIDAITALVPAKGSAVFAGKELIGQKVHTIARSGVGRTFQTGGATNVFKYSDPEVDRLLTAGRAESDSAKRKPIYDSAQRILACQGPIMHIAYGTLFAAVRDELKGFAPMPTRSLRTLREATLGK